ncbi:sugar phosphate isomerase/epimerase [Streptomyces sp. NBC_00347]|uniref:sugar phosphate isomerase/epimerase family protein n=1 Tax=Streptomyces sp. NBC_00347 TaxID=2975721 RepID=UPI002259ABF9|nr:TIM barrel protein [Streptomyces sp. NBC_00347]MCX5124676.1 sugar phosphate isomerase/epimerase [Streptomyces sp. NBC_00347]
MSFAPSFASSPVPRLPLTGLVDWRLPVRGEAAVDLAFQHRVEGLQFDLGGPGRGPWLDKPGTAGGAVGRLRRTASAAGVTPLGVAANVLNDIGLTAAAGTLAAARVRSVIDRLLDVAWELGVPLVFLPSFRRSAIDGEAALMRTAEVLRWAAAQAQAHGLLLANENVLPAHQALRLVEEVGSPAFRLLLDSYNPVGAGIDVPDLVEATAPFLADQIHLKDGPGAASGPLLGDGDGRVEETVDAVARHLPGVHAVVLENDHRDGDRTRLRADLERARALARRLHRRRMEAAQPCPSY